MKKIAEFFKGKNILITGGTGMIGRAIIRQLYQIPCTLVSVSLDDITLPGVTCIKGDLADFNFCKEITKGIDYCFHVAGIKGSASVTTTKPASFFVPLLQMNTNILEACRLNNVEKIVYTSSIGAYSSKDVFKETTDIETDLPMDVYPGFAKRMAELQIRAYNIQYKLSNFAIVRLCSVYGPGDSFDPNSAMVIPALIYRVYHKVEDPVVIWGDGSAIRDFAYCDDIAVGIIKALHFGTKSRYYNLGSGKGVSIKQLVETLRKIVDFNYVFDTSVQVGYSKRVMDITLARKYLDYKPTTSLEAGLKKTYDWFSLNAKAYKLKKNYFQE